MHDRGSDNRKLPGSSPSGRAENQANCTTEAPPTARSQDRTRAAAKSDPNLWMTAPGFDPGPSRRRAGWRTAALDLPGDFPGGPERGSGVPPMLDCTKSHKIPDNNFASTLRGSKNFTGARTERRRNFGVRQQEALTSSGRASSLFKIDKEPRREGKS